MSEFDRLVRIKELKQLIGLSNATIYRLVRNGTFPKQIHLSDKCVAWRLSAIETWIRERQSK